MKGIDVPHMTKTFICPKCESHQPMSTADTRYCHNRNIVTRRRECQTCGERFTTHEIVAKTETYILVPVSALADAAQGLTNFCQQFARIGGK